MEMIASVATYDRSSQWGARTMHTRFVSVASLTLCWLSVAGCGVSEDVSAERSAKAVSSSRQCGAQEIAPGLLMRRSTYSSEGIPGDTISVVELCHPERGCNAAAAYQDGMAPIVMSRQPELVIQIPMATDLRVFSHETWIGGRRVALRIESKPIRTEAELDSARRGSGLPPGRFSYDSCQSDLAIRPFYRTATP